MQRRWNDQREGRRHKPIADLAGVHVFPAIALCCLIIGNVCGRSSEPDSPLAGFVVDAFNAEVAHHLAARRTLEGSHRMLRDVSVNYRTLIAELLEAGRAAEDTGHAATVIAMQLFEARLELDAMLSEIDRKLESAEEHDAIESETLVKARRAADHLERFHRVLIERREPVRPGKRDELLAQLAPLLVPLADAVIVWTGESLVSRWLVADAPQAVRRAMPSRLPNGGRDSLLSELSTLRDAMRQEMLRARSGAAIHAVLDALERAAEFPEYHIQAHEAIRSFRRAAHAADALTRATWLNDVERTQRWNDLHRMIEVFESPETRPRSLALLDALEERVQLIERINRLAELGVEGEALRTLHRAQHSDAVEIVQHARETALDEVPGVLQSVARELDRRRDEAERDLLASLRNDDDHASSLERFAVAQRMRRAMSHAPRLIETAEKIDPRQARAAERRVIQQARLLLDPVRRSVAAHWLERVVDQIELYAPVPFERDLREPTRAAAVLTGGRQGELASELDRLREAWLRQWARPEVVSDERARLDHFRALARAMHDAAPLVNEDTEALAARLNGWALWHMPEAAVARHVNETTSRLRIASHAFLEHDSAVLEKELAALAEQGATGRVIGRLARIMPEPDSSPSPLIAALSDVTILPPADAWMIEEQESIAALCRLGYEWLAAQEAGDEAAEQFQVRAARTATALLDALDRATRLH